MGHGVKIDVAFFAEASEAIGTGHLVEILQIASQCKAAGIRPWVLVGKGISPALTDHTEIPLKRIDSLEPESLAREIRRECAGVPLAVTNFRQVSSRQIQALQSQGARVVCFDEWGNRPLPCDAVINPSLVSRYHRYNPSSPGFRLYAGPQYLPLHRRYDFLHKTERKWDGPISSVVVSMGGADRSGTTSRILQALKQWNSPAMRHIVVGPLFQQALAEDLSSTGPWQFHRGMTGLADLFAKADVGITAGGNTLYELACVGTPALTLAEDLHEKEQAKAFEEQGFGRFLEMGTEMSNDCLLKALAFLEDSNLRRRQGEQGKHLVDGAGTDRILQIFSEQTSLDPTFMS